LISSTRLRTTVAGREGEIMLAGFSPRKANLVLYIGATLNDDEIMSRLGKHKRGKSPGGSTNRVELKQGEYAINPPGVWHTADIEGEATGVFITAGAGTEVRPR